MKRLTWLDLRNNQLAELPPSIADLKNLHFLDLRGNQFANIPESTLSLPNLQKLDLRWNRLSPQKDRIQSFEKNGCLIYA